uniref:NADH dehydrogenase subunit 6 n=1 Tax=Halice sp. JL-2018 TaxID=2528348 RepID=A0A3Q8LZC1_9CRUS|nr:NADH dehydrogenase subunit 6 [Halice sp. JL-2018]
MSFIMYFFLLLNMSLMFIYTVGPLGLGLIIVIQTLFISGALFMVSTMTWFSYVLIMIFLSGMMVLFIYVACLASNEMVSISYFNMITGGVFSGVFSIYIWSNQESEDMPLVGMNFFYEGVSSSLVYKVFSEMVVLMSFFMILYLLLVLIVSVYISYLSKGPMQMKI